MHGGGNSSSSNSRWSTSGGLGGGGGGGRPGVAATSTVGPTQTLGQRQVQQQQEHQRAQQRQSEAKKREEMLAQENARLKRQLAARSNQPGDGDLDMGDELEDDDANEMPEEERRQRIEETKSGLPYLASKYGESSEELAEAKRELAALERASREAKPYKTHRAQLERRKERLTRKRDKTQEECEGLQSQISELQTRLADLAAENEARDKEIAEVDSELRELLRKAIAEGDEGGEPAKPPDPTAAWNTVSAALEGMAAQPGVPREWAAQLGGLLEQLRTAAVAIQTQAAMASGGGITGGTHVIGTAASPPQHAQGRAQQAATVPATNGGSGSGSTTQQQPTIDNVDSGTGTTGGGGPVPATPKATDAEVDTDKPPRAQAGGGSSVNDSPTVAAAAAATTEAGGAPTTPKDTGSQRDGDEEGQDTDEDMWSIAEDDLDLRDGETTADRKQRVRRQLRERQRSRAEAKRAERQQADRKGKSNGPNASGAVKTIGSKTKSK